ncbi:hypothetical protein PUNSTDRAFT_138437 [Punctularia strigosozonata HHB-11173 SS5]|uniref:F-box domain-containing protein n=1 Tax=Punctularia strigosozonata (strain HHB-11173) TaxID=741275 RepID=R7S4Q8_PUNST|nr:uncharacterized protein PUNSTDRAFT_138437 [Punctularia strigosozonata HHB-11173 SS5]EIN04792.1 hypothetical protein PUNSTDRAFT_138437 [Punctularia strigosozonata HHB-11173 SS5]
MTCLPLDIINLIIDEIDDAITLQATSVVCKSLVDVSQRRLFRSVTISRAAGVGDMLKSNKRIAELVQTLRLFPRPDHMDILAVCTGLRALTLEYINSETINPFTPTLPSHIQSLRLGRCRFGSYGLFSTFIRANSHLRRLVMDDCDVFQGGGSEEPLKSQLALQILVVSRTRNHLASTSLFAPFHLDRVSELSITLSSTNDVALLHQVLCEAGLRLITMRITISRHEDSFIDGVCECLSTASKSSLRDVTLIISDSRHWNLSIALPTVIVNALSTPGIERIALNIWPAFSFFLLDSTELEDWEALDSALASTDRFPSLKEVSVFRVTCEKAMVHPHLSRYLPRCATQGILLSKSQYVKLDMNGDW